MNTICLLNKVRVWLCVYFLDQLNTYGRRAFLVAGPMAWNSLPDFIRDPMTVLGVYSKRTCSRVTSASSALAFLSDYALYKSTHSLIACL